MSHRRKHLTVGFALATALALTSCSPAASPEGSTPGSSTTHPWDVAAGKAAITALPAGYLEIFDSCAQLLTYFQANALEVVGPYGIGGGARVYGDDMVMEESAGDAASAGSQAGGAAGPAYSETNVQEEGVDEADVVKTNGKVIVTATGGKVRIVDVANEEVIATIRMPGRGEGAAQPRELLLHENTLVILGEEWPQVRLQQNRIMAFPASRTVVTSVDISDPAQPQTLGSLRVEGSYVAARMTEGTVRLVLRSEPPSVEQVQPESGRLSAEEESEQTNRDLIQATTIDDWIPHAQHLSADGQIVSTEQLLGCDQISRPRDPAGLSTLSVLSMDIASDGEDASVQLSSGTGLVAKGSTVYASTDRVVVATSAWDRWWGMDSGAAVGPALERDESPRTDLHTFDISDPDSTSYQASGSVPGYLLNQWGIDEASGILRVATTTDPPGASQDSQSSLVVLTEEGDELVETGRVDGLGVTEQIRAVRYLSDDLAAVVTFRQTDPLYLIDTSNPAAPTVAGELKIPGYSAYLHPIEDGWLLGVGQDADVQTGQTEGLQVSLFDLRDLSKPKQTKVVSWPNAWSEVEAEHRAFLYWPATGAAIIPFHQWSETQEGRESGKDKAGVLKLAVGPGKLERGMQIPTKPPNQAWAEPPIRSMVIGEDLWTLSYQGLAKFDLATGEGGWAVDLG